MSKKRPTKEYNQYSIHRIDKPHLKTKGDSIAERGRIVTVYKGKNYEREPAGFWNLDNDIEGIRQVTGWKPKRKKKKSGKKSSKKSGKKSSKKSGKKSKKK